MSVTAATTLLDQVNNLPTIPKVVRDLLREFDKPSVDVDRVAALVSSDPVIATKLLRLANSVFYRRSGTVSRIKDVVIFLGTQAVRNLVLATGLTASLEVPSNFPRQTFWRYSLHTAVAARYLAKFSYLDAELAFTIGLVRSIGEPLMYGVMGEEMKQLDGIAPFYDRARPQLELRQFQFSHVDLAADLAVRWHFPEALSATLRHSQAPVESDPLFKIAGVIQLGAWIAGEAESGGDTRMEVAPEIAGLMLRLGQPLDLLADMPPLAELAEGLEILVD